MTKKISDSPNLAQVPESACHSLRLACLDLTRVTEQLAILASFAAGISRVGEDSNRGQQVRTLRPLLGLQFYRSVLSAASAKFNFAVIDPLWLGFQMNAKGRLSPPPANNQDSTAIRRIAELGEVGGFPDAAGPGINAHFPPIDLIVNPICGIEDLAQGRFGVLSALAGVARTTGLPPMPYAQPVLKRVRSARGVSLNLDEYVRRVDRYLVICTQKPWITDFLKTHLDTCWEKSDDRRLDQFTEIMSHWRRDEPYDGIPLISVSEHEKLKPIFDKLSRTFVVTLDDRSASPGQLVRGRPLRCLHGSKVSAAIASMMPDKFSFDVFVGVVRSATAHTIAVCSRALGATFRAIPLHPESGPADSPWNCLTDLSGAVLKDDDLINSKDCFFVGTGVTPHLLLRGIRIRRDSKREAEAFEKKDALQELLQLRAGGVSKSQTVILNGSARTTRFMNHERNLAHDTFYWGDLDSDLKITNASEAIDTFVKRLFRLVNAPAPGHK